MSISVHIVTFNSASCILPCLESVLHQNCLIDRIIIVDNQSTDGTIGMILEWQQSHPELDLTLIRQPINIGFAPAHNAAILESQTDYVLVLNPDVVLTETYVSEILDKMERSPEIGSATGKLYRDLEKRILDSTGLRIKKNRRVFDRGAEEIDDGQWDEQLDVFGVSGAAAVYRRRMIDQLMWKNEFFDEDFFAYKEDVDVAWRAQLLGWKAAFVPDAIALHARGWKEGSRKEVPVFIRRHSYINRYFYILKNDTPSFWLLHSPYILFFEGLSISYTLLRERELLAAWRSFFNLRKKMIKKREARLERQTGSYKRVYRFLE
ncbi:glycosyltransferase family 2 protein [Pullulanibacillus sp. KACC 23026]|uniref:glycosyltransferase family 2 protein n=1 Tax=Pullulanibacillus sp. KACC 23026 TaxID=3028315 RepID=UPI0023AF0FE2|nr:glycosyltransferase family 2 protein [Pullulanibacillus sp. KACC 23026]WEG13301.1 glycosyltransferase family 2 protein [Pullulanibacillus sp. KACC 23026]